MAVQKSDYVSCKVTVVGAGIGGLTAAIALRRAGHEVHVYEQSRFASEVGAAIHVCPNANSVLQQIGVDHEQHGGMRLAYSRFLSPDGELLSSLNLTEDSHRWQKPWLVTHRADLHSHLKAIALSEIGDGQPIQLHTSSQATGFDAQAGIIRLNNGESIQSDLVIGADGVHSKARYSVLNKKQLAEFTPNLRAIQNAFRFMIPIEAVRADPKTEKFIENIDSLDMYHSDDRKVVAYTCNGGTSLNMVCCHPASASGEYKEGYSHETSRAKLLEVYKEFGTLMLGIMDKVNEEELKIHPLLDMDTLPTYASGRVAIIGDAAHPFTPHMAQGAAMAIEDGVSLGVMLSELESTDEIPDRLQLYNKARHERATTIQEMTRIMGAEPARSPTANSKVSGGKFEEYMDFAFNHDEIHHSKQLLREYKWAKAPRVSWRQPVGFGPMATPRQSVRAGNVTNPRADGLADATSRIASFRFRTSATILKNLFPSDAYSFSKVQSVAEASFIFQAIENLSWLGGRGYNLVLFQIHGVQYKSPSDGTIHEGSYIPVLFEDLADPIISGREDLGWPKLFSEIHVKNNIETGGGLSVDLSWRGTHWASFSWKDLQQLEEHNFGANGANGAGTHGHSNRGAAAESSGESLFVHKYIPTTTRSPSKQAADADYDVMVRPQFSTDSSADWQQVSKEPSFEIINRSATELPTLGHVAERLAEIPVYEIVEAKVGVKQGQDDLSESVRIS